MVLQSYRRTSRPIYARMGGRIAMMTTRNSVLTKELNSSRRHRPGRKAVLAAAAFVAFSASRSMADLYWDADSALSGDGVWSTSAQNWSSTGTAGAPDSVWTPNDGTQNAILAGAFAGTVRTV